uniref:Uncharacterized protein n=1 Tax=Rhizophora mucronata TaxID=61149 RepID=A0A2P2IKQ3_RHIMU
MGHSCLYSNLVTLRKR